MKTKMTISRIGTLAALAFLASLAAAQANETIGWRGLSREPQEIRPMVCVDPLELERALPIPLPDEYQDIPMELIGFDSLDFYPLTPPECTERSENAAAGRDGAGAARDDRSFYQITSTTSHPYRTIGKLYMRWGSVWYVGSAACMLCDQMLLTAGHCIYNNVSGS